MLYLTIVGFDSLTEIIGAIFVCELCDDGNGLIGFYIGRDFGGTSAGGFMALPQKKDFFFGKEVSGYRSNCRLIINIFAVKQQKNRFSLVFIIKMIILANTLMAWIIEYIENIRSYKLWDYINTCKIELRNLEMPIF